MDGDNESRYIHRLLLNRVELLKIIVLTFFLAFAVNLLAGYVLTKSSFTPNVILIVGSTMCFIAALFLINNLLFSDRIKSICYEAFFIYDHKTNESMLVPNYDFSKELSRNLNALFVENPAIKRSWELEPLSKMFGSLEEDDEGASSIKFHLNNKSVRLISEAAEYNILEILSTTLTDHFNDEEFKDDYLKVYRRGDIPDVLLSNHFLDLFSRPREERPLFAKHSRKHRDKTKTCFEFGPKGAVYNNFDLILPKGSNIKRLKPNELEIDTNRLKLLVDICFGGFSTNLPNEKEFLNEYVGVRNLHKKRQDLHVYSIDINIKVTIKYIAFLTPLGWEYYNWVDSFLDSINDHISKNEYFNRIQWLAAHTVLKCLKGK